MTNPPLPKRTTTFVERDSDLKESNRDIRVGGGFAVMSTIARNAIEVRTLLPRTRTDRSVSPRMPVLVGRPALRAFFYWWATGAVIGAAARCSTTACTEENIQKATASASTMATPQPTAHP
jgi:hypothetical protein